MTTATHRDVYGSDLSGNLQEAGTIGGLLAMSVVSGLQSSVSYYAYDANGNVTEIVDTNGAVVAHYEYDPYGNLSAMTGTAAASNPFRFSTKYLDGETEMYYYGFRFYSPEQGRWLSRDPVEEVAQNRYPIKDVSVGCVPDSSTTGNVRTLAYIGCENRTCSKPRNLATEASQPASALRPLPGAAFLYGFDNNDPVSCYDVLGLSCASAYQACLQKTEDYYRDCQHRGHMFCGIVCAIRCRWNAGCWRRCEQRCFTAYDAACQLQKKCDAEWCGEKLKECIDPCYKPNRAWRWCGSGSDPW